MNIKRFFLILSICTIFVFSQSVEKTRDDYVKLLDGLDENERDILEVDVKARITCCGLIVQRYMDDDEVKMTQRILKSIHNEKKDLHKKIYYNLVNKCFDKISFNDVIALMPKDEELKGHYNLKNKMNITKYLKYIDFDDKILSDSNFDIKLTLQEKLLSDLIDKEISKMEKEEEILSNIAGESNISSFNSVNFVTIILIALFIIIITVLSYGITYLLRDKDDKSKRKQKKDKKK